MQNPDSFDRIVTYFHALARAPFDFKGRIFDPYKILHVSPAIFRDYSCPGVCGACCMRCSLVWDSKEGSVDAIETTYTISNREVNFFVDRQAGLDRKCRHLHPKTGRCGIYKKRPLPCRFELFKFYHSHDNSVVRAGTYLPGRKWALTRIDGTKGGLCQIEPFNPSRNLEYISHLTMIGKWMFAFNIESDVERVIEYLRTGPHQLPMKINRLQKGGFFT